MKGKRTKKETKFESLRNLQDLPHPLAVNERCVSRVYSAASPKYTYPFPIPRVFPRGRRDVVKDGRVSYDGTGFSEAGIDHVIRSATSLSRLFSTRRRGGGGRGCGNIFRKARRREISGRVGSRGAVVGQIERGVNRLR